MGEELSFEYYDRKHDMMTAVECAAFDDAHNKGDAHDVLLQSGLWRVVETHMIQRVFRPHGAIIDSS